MDIVVDGKVRSRQDVLAVTIRKNDVWQIK
jgi:hypothetical protein